MLSSKSALIMVDLQNDFCQGGALAVPEGEAVIPLANLLQTHFDLVIATKDYHPSDHLSFAENHPGKRPGDNIMLLGYSQILWPAHCVQQTVGADFHPKLNTNCIDKVIYKGTDKTVDSYSAFFDNARKRFTGLDVYLKNHKIQQVYFLGLATEYCVKYSCLDAIELGFDTYIIEDACRGIDLYPGDIKAALAEMEKQGVIPVTSAIILQG